MMKRVAILVTAAAACVSALSTPKLDYAGSGRTQQQTLYNNREDPTPIFVGDVTESIPATEQGPPAPDDALYQTLASAEWYVVNFYTRAVDLFNASSFTDYGFPNTTHDRIKEIRDNEAGHLGIMFSRISPTSTKPGPCKYNITFTNPIDFFISQIIIEGTAPAFVPGITLISRDPSSRGLFTALAEVETRHTVWSLLSIFRSNPFAGAIETVFPYPLKVLASINQQIIPGSCAKGNPVFPNPPQDVKPTDYDRTKSNGEPGSEIQFTFPDPRMQPKFEDGKEYQAVFFHALRNVTVPFDPKTRMSRVPEDFDKGKGIVIAVIADQAGAPTEESVVAGPLILLQQPDLGQFLASVEGRQ